MKKFKKIIAMCLATVMAMSVMCVGAFAAEPEVSESLIIDDEEISLNALIDGKQFIGSGYINGNGVNLRAGASTSYTSLGLMYSGDQVAVYSDTTSSAPWWIVVVTSGNCKGKTGYVHINYVTVSDPARSATTVTE